MEIWIAGYITMNNLNVRTKLRTKRLRMGVSIETASKEIGVSSACLQGIEAGKFRNPTINTLVKMSGFYRCTLNWLSGLLK